MSSAGLVYSVISDRAPVRLAFSRSDVVLSRPSSVVRFKGKQSFGGGVRAAISGLSPRSRRRMLLTARAMPDPSHMITLTYPARFPGDGVKVKRDLAVFRKWLVRMGVYFGAWMLEFQARGAPHFHLYFIAPSSLPSDFSAVLSRRWFEIVGSGDEKHLRAGTRFERLRCAGAAARYMAKYSAKAEQKLVPEGYERVGRFWGYWGLSRADLFPVVVDASIDVAAQAVRVIRRHAAASRRALRASLAARGLLFRCALRRRRYSGSVGFTAWGAGALLPQLFAHHYLS